MSEMILVQVPKGVGPIQVEFPEHRLDGRGKPLTTGAGKDKKPMPFGERSCEGAMHLRPGSTKLMTMAELDHIRTHLPEGRRLQVIRKTDPEAKKAEAAAAAKAAEQATAQTGVRVPDSDPEPASEADAEAKSGSGKKPKK